MNNLSPTDKKHIYDMLADAYIEVVNRQLIGKYERKVLCKKVLEAVEGAKTTQDIINFLHILVKNYPFFQFAEKIFNNEIGQLREQKVINQLQGYIKNIKIA